MDDNQVDIEIRLADIRTALVFVWAIMLLVAERFIDSIVASSFLVVGSIGLVFVVVLVRIPRGD